uniref:YspA cpYpsA-related SLOG domain-containing protein n=1 Tax=viral metagenome TaxID=1070528 RepID=A0A6C0BN01_9ZZZZ
MKLAIVGSRDFQNEVQFNDWMREALAEWSAETTPPILVVSGGARGADSLGEKWANARGIETLIFKPDWKTHGKRAGILRNYDIISAATHVIAFPSRHGRGTQHSIRVAREQQKPVLVYWID